VWFYFRYCFFLGCSAAGGIIPVEPKETFPSTPTYVYPVNNSIDIDNFSLVWNQCYDTSGSEVVYELYFGEELSNIIKIADNLSTTYYNLQDLDLGKTYYWKVISRNLKGKLRSGEIWMFTTKGNMPPEKPDGIFPYDNMVNVDFNVKMIWAKSNDTDGHEVTYDMYFGNSPLEMKKVLENATETSYSTDLTDSKTYFWKVIAEDSLGGKSESDVYKFTTKGNIPPSKVILKSPVDESDNNELNLTLEWNESVDQDGDAVSYDLYMFGSLFPYTLIASDLATVTYNLENLQFDSLYCWEIMAKDSRGGSTLSDTFHFRTKSSSPPSKPDIVSPVNFSFGVSTDCTLEWSESVDPDGTKVLYDVYLGVNADNIPLLLSDIDATSVKLNLERKKIYFAKVRAKKGSGSYSESDMVRFTTEVSIDEIDNAVGEIFVNFNSPAAQEFCENAQFNESTNSGTITISASDTRFRKLWEVFGQSLKTNEAILFPFELKDIGDLSGEYVQYGPEYMGDDENKDLYKNAVNWRLGYAGILDIRLSSIGKDDVIFSPVINNIRYDFKFIFK